MGIKGLNLSLIHISLDAYRDALPVAAAAPGAEAFGQAPGMLRA